MYISDARNGIEKLHIDFLCRNFKLQRPNNGLLSTNLRFDLVRDKNIFELKSRSAPKILTHKRKRYLSDYEWWQLDVKQTEEYEEWSKSNPYSLYWIFIRGDTNRNITDMKKLRESSIINREIYVLPWNCYKLVSPNPTGRVRHIGLGRIRSNYSFREMDLFKGKIYIEKNIESELLKYFT